MIPDRAESGELDVSVIIPVYNVEDYLPECLDSLVNQALGSFTAEVIAVDDGSTDASGSILDEYAARYDFVRVIHQENSGWPG
ncbi:glycosyltransferase, partial [Geobacillus sp. MMMUD3]|nr:glycosyltransferase [Geobacillus sp. MMMUD3]